MAELASRSIRKVVITVDGCKMMHPSTTSMKFFLLRVFGGSEKPGRYPSFPKSQGRDAGSRGQFFEEKRASAFDQTKRSHRKEKG